MDVNNILNITINVATRLIEQHQWLGYFFNVLFKSSIIFIVVALITLLLKKYSAAARHLIWIVALVSLLALPLIISIIPSMDVALSSSITTPNNAEQKQIITETVQLLSASISHWAAWFQLIYFVIALLFILYTILGIYRIHLFSQAAQPINNESNLNALQLILKQEGILDAVEIRESSNLLSPLSWGLFKPVIILPCQARQWSQEKIRNVLIHEVCHIQRLDWLSHVLSRCALAMYWCNPLVWYAVRKLGEEAEQACDDAVVLYGHSQSLYANDLLEIAQGVKQHSHRHLLAEAIAHSFLGSRVIAILDSNRVRNKTESVWAFRALLVTLTTVAILASLRLVPEVNTNTLNWALGNSFSIIYISDPEAREDNVTSNFSAPLTIATKPVLENTVYGAALPVLTKLNTKVTIAAELFSAGQNDLPLLSPEITIPKLPLDEIILSNNNLNRLNPLQKSTPIYPKLASQRGLEGYAIVEFEISVTGTVINPIIIESSPGSTFNRSSLEAIQQYRYRPLMLNGEAIGVNGVRTRFIYQLNPKPG